MQPSTWNQTNQHWISQFLLKGFGISGKAGRVWELNVANGEIEQRKVKRIASKAGLMSDRDDELMRQIERNAATIIQSIRKGDLDIGLEGRRAVDEFVLALLFIAPRGEVDVEKARRETIQATAAELINAVAEENSMVNPEPLLVDAISDVGLADQPQSLAEAIDRRINHDYLTLFMADNEGGARQVLSCMGLQVHRVLDGEFLVIGDSPVMVVRRNWNGARKLDNPGGQVILPISSSWALVYSWSTPRNILALGPKIDRWQVRTINNDYFRESRSEYIYGRTSELLMQARHVPLMWDARERPMEVADGWVEMQKELSKKREREDNEDAVRVNTHKLLARSLIENTMN